MEVVTHTAFTTFHILNFLCM